VGTQQVFEKPSSGEDTYTLAMGREEDTGQRWGLLKVLSGDFTRRFQGEVNLVQGECLQGGVDP
jgi:hypothetical protein